jgi:hypothetical protein
VLRWQLRPDLKDLEAVAKKRAVKGLPTLEWDNRPQIKADYAWLLDGFWMLCRTRSSNGFGGNPLTLVEIGKYLDEIGIRQPATRLMFLDVMLALDAVYLESSYGRHQGSSAKPEGR